MSNATTPTSGATDPGVTPMEPDNLGLLNLRDLGGHLARDGRRTRPGRIFRADSLGVATPADTANLAAIGVRLVCDLRSEREITAAPSRFPETARYEHLPMALAFNVMTASENPNFNWSEFELEHLFVAMIDGAGPVYLRVFEHLAQADSYPFLFHCTAGKDRTGTVAALILRAAGVPDETIVADFTLTEERILPRRARFMESMRRRGMPDAAEKMLSAPAEAMRATLAHIDERYGSTSGYLDAIGVQAETLEAFRTNLLD